MTIAGIVKLVVIILLLGVVAWALEAFLPYPIGFIGALLVGLAIILAIVNFLFPGVFKK